MTYVVNCDKCGRFVNAEAPGVSWSQTWSYGSDGPELHDAQSRCSPCTNKHGIGWTNCAPSYGGNGRIPAPPPSARAPLNASVGPGRPNESPLSPQHTGGQS